MKLKETNEKTRKTNKSSDTDNSVTVNRGKRAGDVVKGKMDQYMVIKDDFMLRGQHTMQYEDHML